MNRHCEMELCDKCKEKTGAFVLCTACLHNRDLIADIKQESIGYERELRKYQFAFDCVLDRLLKEIND